MSYGGSSGSGRISTASDAALSNPSTNNFLVYNGATQKWSNVTLGSVIAGLPTSANGLASGSLWLNNGVLTIVTNGTSSTLSNTVAPSISGTATVGQTLTANTGAWSPAPDSYTYQWSRAGSAIGSATGASYTAVSADASQIITVTVTAIKSGYASVAAVSSGVTVSAASSSSGLAVMTRSGSALQVNGATKRFGGANAYWLGLNDNAGNPAGSFPSHATITNAMTGMKEMGVNLVRAHTVGISVGTPNSYETTVGTYSDSNLDAADWAVYQAGLNGIYLMIPLTDNWNYYHGGKWNFVHWAYQQNPSGITDVNGQTKDDVNERQFFANTTAGLRIRALYKDYISHWLNHVNPYTGLAYKDDPAIAIIETGNEIYYAAQLGSNEWTQDIASYIKGIAPNKLVADGSAADRVAVSNAPGLSASAVDIMGAHYYPQTQSGSYPPTTFGDAGAGYAAGTALQQLTADATAAANAGKAFIVGEFPWTRSDVGAWYGSLSNNANISADLFWSYIADNESHGGAFGSDDYPVHRPYAAGNEATYAPALSRHIAGLSGIAPTNGAGTDPTAATNLISSNAVIHASNASLFTAGSATVSLDSSTYQEGGSSIKVTPTGQGVYPYVYGSTPSQWAPVTAGSQYTAVASVRTATSGSFGFQVALVWYKSDGTYISSTTGSYVSATTGSWIQISETATAPAAAAYAVVQVQAGSSMNTGDVFNIDEYGIYAGTSTIWNG